MKNLLLSIFITAISLQLAMAQAQQGTSFILNQPLSGNQHYQASQFIEMTTAPAGNGFQYTAIPGNGEFQAEIDPFMVVPPAGGETGGPNPTDNGVVGSIGGAFNVSEMGQANYAIPIKLPDDFKGMKPTLSIAYSGQSSNGLLGVGWNISGISGISRTGSTVYHDGLTKGIKFDETDNFILDGHRLMKVNDIPNGTNNCEYRTEQESFSRVYSKQLGMPLFQNGPESFIVVKKDGSKWYYGTSENSRLASVYTDIITTTTNYLWLLDKVEDIKGNYISYTYNKNASTNEIYIDEIKYTGFANSDGSVTYAPNYSVKFVYEERQDKEFAFIRDIKTEKNKILKQITICKKPEEMVLYTYTMNYNYDGKYNCLESVMLTDKEGLSYNPPKFVWEKPATHPASQETLPVLGESFLFSGDFNGDGFTDFLKLPELTDEPYSSSDKLTLVLNNKNGGFTASSFEKNLNAYFQFIKVCDINGDMIADFLYCENTSTGAYKITPFIADGDGGFSELQPIENNDYLNAAVSCGVGDFLGLGKSGVLIKRGWSIGGTKYFAWKLYYYNNLTSNMMDNVAEGNIDSWGSINEQADFNGDGKTDIMVVNEGITKIFTFERDANNNLVLNHFYNSGFPTIWHRTFTGDFNGDGRTDLLTYNTVTSKWEIAYFKENNFDWPALRVDIPGGDPEQYTQDLSYYRGNTDYEHLIFDFDGNGKDDIVTFKYTEPTVQNQFVVETAVFETHMNIAYMFPNKSIIYKTDKFENQTRFLRKTLQIGDFYSKGRADILIAKCTQSLKVHLIEWSPQYGDYMFVTKSFPTIIKCFDRKSYLITEFIDGLSNSTSVQYDKLTSSGGYTNTGNSDFGSGIFDISLPLNVVRQTTMRTINYERNLYYWYQGLKLHTKGKGILGFSGLQTYDDISNTYNVKTNSLNYYNAFLFPASNTVYLQYIAEDYIISKQTFGITRAISPYSPKIYSLQLDWQLNHLYEEKGIFKKTELTKYIYDSYTAPGNNYPYYRYGNVTRVEQLLSKDKLDEYNTNYEFKTETTTTYNDDPDYVNIWLVSLVKDSKSTQSTNMPGSTPAKSSFINEYYPKSNSMGFPFIKKTTEKPNDTENHSLSVVNEFTGYDIRGNLLNTTTSAPNYQPALPSSTSAVEYSNTYQKRFPTSTTNAMGNTATSTFDPVYGTLKTSTGPNGLTTTYDNNPLGTYSKTISPDGITSISVTRWAKNHPNAPQDALYYTWQQTSGSPAVIVFYHKTGAELRAVTFGFDGAALYVDKLYNWKGLLHKESLPYKQGEQALYTEYIYDEYNRLNKVISPDNTTTTTSYAANQVSVTVANGSISRTSTKKYNAAGLLIESTDNSGNTVKNEYYSDGNLKKTYIDGQPATTVNIEYDHKGNRSKLIDPNYGTVQTVYNAYGELEQQTNARNETTIYTYDKLGRKTSETGGPEGDITWIYSTTPGRIGALESIIKSNHRTNHTYDDLLRLVAVTEIINGTSFVTSFTYDELGRTATTTYPTGVTLRDGYNEYGFASTVSLAKNNKQLWKTESVNSAGHVTRYKTGNGLVTDQTFYPLSLRPYTVKTAKQGNAPVQDLEYGWYGLGNLEYRQKWINRSSNNLLKEQFTYDDLDRLLTINLNGIQTGNHSYDSPDLGNITAKVADGSTIFSSALYGTEGYGPNAITEVNTTYPALTGPRQDITYNAYDKVSSITEGIHRLSIQYGHDMQRITQRYSDGTNTVEKVYASACEYITKNGQLYKHTYLSGPMGLFAIHIIKPDGTEEINYIHADHLGSWNTITDENGNLLQELSFDAWGNRRNPATWRAFTGTAPEPLFDRGFTGHEHLYAFALINMNGRMYDPVLGRMLSPDPYMQAPDFSQSFNRYSYCFNNPLVYTDPSGYWSGWDDVIVGAVGFAYGYVSYGLTNGDWGWKAVGAGALSAGMFLIGYYSGGTASMANSANFCSAEGLQVVANKMALEYSSNMVMSSTFSSMMPSYTYTNGDASFSVSPSFLIGSGNYSVGVNFQASFTDGDVTVGGAYGFSYGRSGYTGITGWETRTSLFGGYDDGKFGIGLSSNYFESGVTSQSTGRLNARYKDFSVSYENDGFPFDKIGIAGGTDSYRTASVTIGYKDISLGMLLFTGYRDFDDNAYNVDGYPNGVVTNPEIRQYNAGILYLGYGNMRAGVNHDNIRHVFQNRFAHGWLKPQEWIPRRHEPIQPYFVYGTHNPYTNW